MIVPRKVSQNHGCVHWASIHLGSDGTQHIQCVLLTFHRSREGGKRVPHRAHILFLHQEKEEKSEEKMTKFSATQPHEWSSQPLRSDPSEYAAYGYRSPMSLSNLLSLSCSNSASTETPPPAPLSREQMTWIVRDALKIIDDDDYDGGIPLNPGIGRSFVGTDKPGSAQQKQ